MNDNKNGMLKFYVSPQGNDAWSGRIAAPNQNKTDGPFAGISEAKNAVRRLKRQNKLRSPAVINIRQGLYQQRQPLVFTPSDSGPSDFPINYRAYPGEKPVISGGRRISGWKKSSGSLWSVTLPEVKSGKWYFSELFVNGRRRCRARLPREGYYHIEGLLPADEAKGVGDVKCRAFKFAPGDIKTDLTNLRDIEVVVLHFWVDVHLPIADVDEKNQIVTFTRASRRKLVEAYGHEKARYYLDNVFEGLCAPGQWYLNKRTGVLYYWPMPGETMDQAEIIAPRLPSILRLEGDPAGKRHVENLKFTGLTFSHNQWDLPAKDAGDYQAAFGVPGAIVARGARNCSFEDCRVRNVKTYAFEFGDGCGKNAVIRNEISETGAGGIKISGGDASSSHDLRTADNVISDNHIHHVGQIFPSAVGILIGHSAGNTISHNNIHHTFYTAISVGWVWGFGPSVSVGNLIEFNHIHHVSQGVLSDLGGIYLLGVAPGTVVRNNLIHDVAAHSQNGWGIYTDEGSAHVIIEDNICYHTDGGFHQHFGRDIVVRNNILAFNRKGAVGAGRAEGPYCVITFERNIIVTDGAPSFEDGYNILTTKKFGRNPVISDLNIFWDSHGKAICFALPDRKLSMRQWQKSGYDQHSLVIDPGFKNLAKLDFSLWRNSPALKLGFVPIDLSEVGPRPAIGRS